MPRGSELTAKEKIKIDKLRKKNLSYRQIAEKINRSKTLVGNYLKDPTTYGVLKRSGRKKKASNRTKRAIIKLASNSSISCAKIKHDLNINLSRWTIRNVINESGVLKFQKIKSLPPLSAKNIEHRLKWAREHMSWKNEWKGVVWSDEKKFNLDGPDGNSYYWHDLRKEQIFSKRRQQGGGSVMIWASFAGNGKSEICFIDKKMNNEDYRKLLNDHLLNIGKKIGGNNWIFQQDNAPAHRAKANFDWFKARKINVMDWPAQSPDLNPMENLWAILSRKVYSEGKQYDSKEDLKKAIIKSWALITAKETKTLIDSMPGRVFELIRLNGLKTHY